MDTKASPKPYLYRSSHGYIGGVCEGLGEHLGITPLWLRLIWIAAVLFAGTGILIYLALWWVLPREDAMPVEPVVWRRGRNGTHHPPLVRTSVDRKILGVCGGIARRWNLDPSLVRLLALSLATLSLGLVVIVYLVAAIVIPGPHTRMRAESTPVQL